MSKLKQIITNTGKGVAEMLSPSGEGVSIAIKQIRKILSEKKYFVNPVLKEYSMDCKTMINEIFRITQPINEDNNLRYRELSSSTKYINGIELFFYKNFGGYKKIA